MSSVVFETMLKRDRLVVSAALVLISVIAWAYILWLAASMGMSEMPPTASERDGMAGMDMAAGVGAAVEPAFREWSVAAFVFTFSMWAVMMVGMMTPSVAPMVLLYAGVGRRAAASGHPLASTGWFFGGYLLTWIAFSGGATAAQWGLTQFALLTPMMTSESGVFGGIVLIAAGLYQWSPLKDTCLTQCQTPLGFLMSHGGFRSDAVGSLRLGAEHGAYCVGCCWVLMTLLFVGGVMNVLWIAGLAFLILFEKVVQAGRLVPRVAGTLITAAGLLLLFRSI